MYHFSAMQCIHVFLTVLHISFFSSFFLPSLSAEWRKQQKKGFGEACPLTHWEVHNSSHKAPDNQLKLQKFWSWFTDWHKTHSSDQVTYTFRFLVSTDIIPIILYLFLWRRRVTNSKVLWREDKLRNVWVSEWVQLLLRTSELLCGSWTLPVVVSGGERRR